MLTLKKPTYKNSLKEWKVIRDIPKDENGFTNEFYGISYEDYLSKALVQFKEVDKGINLPIGWVPASKYFLYDNDKIVAVYSFRKKLNDFLREGPGHIGYCTLKKYRGKGYASKGLNLLIAKAKKIIKEDEIYLACNIDNPASLKVQINCGAYIHHSDDQHHYTRIKIR